MWEWLAWLGRGTMHSAELITPAHVWTVSRRTDALAPVERDIVSSRVPRNLPCH